MHTHTLRFNQNFTLPRHLLAGAMIFTAAYFVTISVNAQTAAQNPPDVIQMNDNDPTTATGTITEVDGKTVTAREASKTR